MEFLNKKTEILSKLVILDIIIYDHPFYRNSI